MRSLVPSLTRRADQAGQHPAGNLEARPERILFHRVLLHRVLFHRETLRMLHRHGALFLACLTILIAVPLSWSGELPAAEPTAQPDEGAVLWREPDDIASRNLFYGAGGEQHLPSRTMDFVEEDHAGSNPKFYVRDQDGTKWTAKMGVEAKP